MKRSYVEQDCEDLTGQAGWMYTDLMLALMVIFLATISFVPQFTRNSQSFVESKSPQYTYSKIFEESMNSLYEEFNVSKIEADIAQFKFSNGLPKEADIVFAQYVGGYSKESESPSAAIARALAFSQKLDSANQKMLASAATTLSSSSVLKTNQIVVKFTFATSARI